MISVSRKSHIAKLVASTCWPIDSKWWRWYGGCACSCASTGAPLTIAVLSDTGGYLFLFLALQPFVVVGIVVHNGNLNEVLGERRRLNLPLQPRSLPRIVAGHFAVFQRPGKI